jgi:hypothetical protein
MTLMVKNIWPSVRRCIRHYGLLSPRRCEGVIVVIGE